MSTPALRIHLFGLLELVLDGESLLVPSSPKARSLLAYLILHHDRPISRDRLTGLFWPERPDARARRALSQALWQIRSALGPAAARLMAKRDAIAFLIHAKDLLDVEAFEKKVQKYASTQVDVREKSTKVRQYTSRQGSASSPACILVYLST
jgi:DNA-binding SARP family transcriptional activator